MSSLGPHLVSYKVSHSRRACQTPTMRHRKGSRRAQVLSDFRIPPHGQSSATKSPKWCAPETVYDAWLSSREMPGKTGAFLVPGAPRPLTRGNARLALFVLQKCIFDFLKVLWSLHPLRTTLMMTLNIIRSLFPAFRGYSQALIVDELQSLIVSGGFTWSRLFWLITSEILRRMVEGLLDSYSASNESIVLSSARFFVEYKQMEHRVRLDVPTLADPLVRDLLQESDLFHVPSVEEGLDSCLRWTLLTSFPPRSRLPPIFSSSYPLPVVSPTLVFSSSLLFPPFYH